MDYQKSLRYLERLTDYEKISGYRYAGSYDLKRVKNLLCCIGNPHKNYLSVVISGTKGKGSCAAVLNSVLSAASVNTGLFTSPHLFSVRERIRAGNAPVPKKKFAYAVSRVKKAVSKNRIQGVTFFEALTTAALLYFAEEKISIAILEVGLGGRLDATNAVEPLITAITPISYDHTQLLGSSLKSIAREKCGIIHEHSSVVTASQEPEVLDVIKKTARKKDAELFIYGKAIEAFNIKVSLSGTSFSLRTGSIIYKNLKTPLIGRHQAVNAAVAVSLAGIIMRKTGFTISQKHIRRGLRHVILEGRFQIISRRPYVVYDAAHNQASVKALRDTFNRVFNRSCSCVISGISADKDAPAIIKELAGLSENIIYTKSDSPRLLEPNLLADKAHAPGSRCYVCGDINDALIFANEFAGNNGIILVTGSFFLAKDTFKAVRTWKTTQ